MRKLLVVLVIGAVTAGFSLAAPSAGASVAEKSTKAFCKAVNKAYADIGNSGAANTLARGPAKRLAKAFRKAGKSAPSNKVKNAVKAMAAFFQRIGDGDSFSDVFAEDGQKYAKAAATFGKAYVKSCLSGSGVSVPSIPS